MKSCFIKQAAHIEQMTTKYNWILKLLIVYSVMDLSKLFRTLVFTPNSALLQTAITFDSLREISWRQKAFIVIGLCKIHEYSFISKD